jgi:hypothetical protein
MPLSLAALMFAAAIDFGQVACVAAILAAILFVVRHSAIATRVRALVVIFIVCHFRILSSSLKESLGEERSCRFLSQGKFGQPYARSLRAERSREKL